MPDVGGLALAGLTTTLLLMVLAVKTVKIVPRDAVYVVERLGKYRATLPSGVHPLLPFLDRVAYRHTLKEQVIDVPAQACVTRDNVSVEVGGVLHLTVRDPRKASYGIDSYRFAAIQIAQTTMRSVIGYLELEQAPEERRKINADILKALSVAAIPWGVTIDHYEVRNITPSRAVDPEMR